MKNKLSDLNNHLFAELERLGDEELKGEALMREISRAESVSKVASQVIAGGALVLKAKIVASGPRMSRAKDDSSMKLLLE